MEWKKAGLQDGWISKLMKSQTQHMKLAHLATQQLQPTLQRVHNFDLSFFRWHLHTTSAKE